MTKVDHTLTDAQLETIAESPVGDSGSGVFVSGTIQTMARELLESRQKASCSIKPLEWIQRDVWIAYTPAFHLGYITIAYEEGKYWANWDCSIPGSDDLDSLFVAGQEYHNAFIQKFLVT